MSESEDKGSGSIEQLLIAMSAACTLLECAIADHSNQHSLIGMCAIASELQHHACAVHEVLIASKDGKSDNRGVKLEEEIDELDELLTEAEVSIFKNKLVDGCRAMSGADESKDDDDE